MSKIQPLSGASSMGTPSEQIAKNRAAANTKTVQVQNSPLPTGDQGQKLIDGVDAIATTLLQKQTSITMLPAFDLTIALPSAIVFTWKNPNFSAAGTITAYALNEQDFNATPTEDGVTVSYNDGYQGKAYNAILKEMGRRGLRISQIKSLATLADGVTQSAATNAQLNLQRVFVQGDGTTKQDAININLGTNPDFQQPGLLAMNTDLPLTQRNQFSGILPQNSQVTITAVLTAGQD